MTNKQFKCSLQNKPFKHNNFYDPGMTLINLSQRDQSIHNVNSLALNTSVVKAINSKFNKVSKVSKVSERNKGYNSAIKQQPWTQTLYSNGAQKRKGYVILKLGSVSKESNSTSLNLLNALNLSIAQLIISHSNSKLSIETCKPQQHYNTRHNAAFAQNLMQRYVWKHNFHRTLSCQRFTVIRSPFVFKKSREQFALTRKACFVKLPMTKPQQHAYAQHLTATKFPSELQLTFVN